MFAQRVWNECHSIYQPWMHQEKLNWAFRVKCTFLSCSFPLKRNVTNFPLSFGMIDINLYVVNCPRNTECELSKVVEINSNEKLEQFVFSVRIVRNVIMCCFLSMAEAEETPTKAFKHNLWNKLTHLQMNRSSNSTTNRFFAIQNELDNKWEKITANQLQITLLSCAGCYLNLNWFV